MSGKENETRENNQNRNKENHTSKNFIAGAVIGGVVGAAAALLLAPKAGKEIRSGLNNQMTNLLEKTTQLSDDVFEKSNGLAAATKEKTALLSKAVVQQSKEIVNKAKGLTSDSIEEQEESETSYIPINGAASKINIPKGNVDTSADKETDIRKKLEEAQRAFDEAENSIK
ncbi:YtxH domain-containing protein [Neobacillus sp. PS3-12]|jgi:gas vesicle protein|uniref:YtxH domain-containing protein n=1 Tax=Neobacillus sp. PS3-12 TaxID=3070677 RepID=UPI0027E1D2BA|nr:YtxH domain-containing protein [Neobacillus sp. PS3-12]WML54363.1 YtxH domain-containing protein [Neobacillus sp. PS3-12]